MDLRSLLLAADEPLLVAEGVTHVEVLRSVAVFATSVLLALVLQRVLVTVVDREAGRHVGRALGRFLRLLVVAVGAVYALGIVGVRVGPLVGALGVGGVALAFAAQDILQNLVAGVLLQVRHPFRVGEQIRSGDYEGVVDDVNLRAVQLTTYDGLTVYLPNADVLRRAIVNYTRTPYNLTELAVGVAYDTDLQRARQVLLAACAGTQGVRETPAPEAWVHAFGDSSIDIAVRYWHAADIASRWRVRSAVAISVKSALDAAGMTIPFPQRTLWFGPGETTLQLRGPQGGQPPPAAGGQGGVTTGTARRRRHHGGASQWPSPSPSWCSPSRSSAGCSPAAWPCWPTPPTSAPTPRGRPGAVRRDHGDATADPGADLRVAAAGGARGGRQRGAAAGRRRLGARRGADPLFGPPARSRPCRCSSSRWSACSPTPSPRPCFREPTGRASTCARPASRCWST